MRRIIAQRDVENARKRRQAFAAVHVHARQLIGGLSVLNSAVKRERVEGRANVAVGQQIFQYKLLFIIGIVVEWLARRVAEKLNRLP